MVRQKKPLIFLFAGEKSGDFLGSILMENLKTKADVFGVGGPLLKKAGMRIVEPMEQFEIMGFFEVFFSLIKIIKALKRLAQLVIEKNPQYVILIDYPGFNLRFCKRLRNKGYKGKVIQIVMPTIWAHGKKRKQILERYFDHVFCLFPFEEKLIKNATFVGHPLTMLIKKGLSKKQPGLAIFPGSRIREISKNLPLQLEVAKKIDQPLFISFASAALKEKIEAILNQQKIKATLVPFEKRYWLMNRCKKALATSGTVNLELALTNTPTCVMYKVSALEYWIIKWIIRPLTAHFSLPNIILNKRIFPEFYGKRLDVDAMTQALKKVRHTKALGRLHSILSAKSFGKEVSTWIFSQH
jgi:lipid-A-disaccharide synthase